MKLKKQKRPKGIKGQLEKKNNQNVFNRFLFEFFSPNQKGSNTHEDKKRGPDWGKKPIGWIKRRFIQSGVPGGNGRGGEKGTNKSG